MRLIEHWGTVLKNSAVTWVAGILTFFVGALGQTYMAIFAFLAFMPQGVAVLVGGLLVFIVVGGPIILARIVEQPKLTEKLEQKANAEPSSNPPCP